MDERLLIPVHRQHPLLRGQLLGLASDQQAAGEQDPKDQGVGITLEGIPHELVEKEHSQHEKEQQEVGHVLGAARHQCHDNAARHFQGADALAEEDGADSHLLEHGQGSHVAFVCSFLQSSSQGHRVRS